MIKIQNNTPTREPIPAFLQGLAPASLADLSWTDPALGVQDCAWWPEVDNSPALGRFETYGAETLIIGDSVVNVTRAVVPMQGEQLAAAMQQAISAFDAALTAHLDATAQARRYDDRITCMVRAGFPGPFQAEGVAFATWCDTCNAMAYTLLAEVQAGTRPLPATTQALIDTLPAMVWPT